MPRPSASTKVQLTAIAWFALATSTAGGAPLDDGPYVRQTPTGTWSARWIVHEGPLAHVREQEVRLGEQIVVPAVGALPAFEVMLRDASTPAEDEIHLARRTTLFVVADTHGEFEIAVDLLRRHKVIDDQLQWSFGKGHLAVLGDVFDRGAYQTELLWLLYKLEAEARRAGGGVHVMLGNHEAMVLSGDDRYLNAKYQRSAQALGARSYAALWDQTTLLGQWLRSKAAVMKIGDYLCMHGGLAPQAVERKLTLEAINGAVRDVLRGTHVLPDTPGTLASFVMGPTGPLWYRGYFADARQEGAPPPATADDVRSIRDFYDVKRILVGHTRVSTVTPLYGGDVIAVQVYPHRDPKTGEPVMEALRIDGDRLQRARADGSLETIRSFAGDDAKK